MVMKDIQTHLLEVEIHFHRNVGNTNVSNVTTTYTVTSVYTGQRLDGTSGNLLHQWIWKT